MSKLQYKPLTTEKYWLASVKEEVKQIRRWKRRQAFRSAVQTFVVFNLAVLTFVATLFKDQWVPQAIEIVRDAGIMV